MGDSLGKRIRISRKDLHLTQQKLADLSGVSRGYIGNLENDSTNNIGSEFILRLATALGVSPLYLMGEEADPLYGIPDEEDAEETASHTAYTVEAELLLTIYQLLSAEKRHILLNIAKVLRDAEKPTLVSADPAK